MKLKFPDARKEQKMSKEWNEFNRFKQVNDKYLPVYGEGETMATQVATAVNKLVYKWYNDGDVYDNHFDIGLGWVNDISSYANWLHCYGGLFCGVKVTSRVRSILERVFTLDGASDYEDLLYDLACTTLEESVLEKMAEYEPHGSIYSCGGPFRYVEPDDYEEEEW